MSLGSAPHPKAEPGLEAKGRQKRDLFPLNARPVPAHQAPRVSAVDFPAPVEPALQLAF